jgi:hypothetical protein
VNSKKIKQIRKEIRAWMLENQIPLSLFKSYVNKAKKEIKRKHNEKFIKPVRDKRTVSKATLGKNCTEENTNGNS